MFIFGVLRPIFLFLRHFKNVEKYLDAVVNVRTEIPTKAQQTKEIKLTAERLSLCKDYYRLKNEMQNIENIGNIELQKKLKFM